MMVSLRKNSSTPKSNSNFLYSEGERVLCYEPDPNKAKVLYDSKILDIMARDCTRLGKKTEYTVHFFGWNRTYDRIVNEESILKDTPSNRQLQRELAEQAAGRLKGKKLKLNKIPTIIKEVISSLNEQDPNSKDGFEQASNIDSDLHDEDTLSSNLYTTNSNGSTNDLEPTNQDATNSDSQTVLSALASQTAIKAANLFTIVNNQITNYVNQPVNDNQTQELCQQIITNLDGQLKNLLEEDQQLIYDEQTLYSLPVKPEHSVHRILNEFEQFSLRMLNSSIETRLKLRPDDQPINSANNSTVDQSNHLNGINQVGNSLNNTMSNQQSNHQTITRTNRSANQLINQQINQMNQQINQSNSSNQPNQTTNFISNNSNNSTGSSSSLNCSNFAKQSKDPTPTNHSFTSQTIREFTNSVEIYFNTLADKMYLFYSDKEGEQFQQLKRMNNYLKPIHTYGFIHLLRLIILLPDFLSFCSIPYKQLRQLIFLLQQFCDYLLNNQTKFTS